VPPSSKSTSPSPPTTSLHLLLLGNESPRWLGLSGAPKDCGKVPKVCIALLFVEIDSENQVGLYSYANTSHVSHMSYHDLGASYVLMTNKFEKIIVLHVGPHHKRSKTYVWVPKCLVTNLRGPNQTWVPKTKV
jgi:hypothetical protein